MAYQISVSSPANGSLSVTDVDGSPISQADEGQTCLVVATPDSGYLLESLEIAGAEAVGDSFVMPGSSIAVSATFAEEPEEVLIDLDQVAEAAENTQWFWTDGEGAHVTDVPQDEWTAAAEGGFPDASDSKPYMNSLLTSVGQFFRRAGNNLVKIGHDAVEFFDGLGNAASNVVARFGKDYSRMQFGDGEFFIGREPNITRTSSFDHPTILTLGRRKAVERGKVEHLSVAMGWNVQAAGFASTALGYQSEANADYSFAASSGNTDALASYSTALSIGTAKGNYSLAACGGVTANYHYASAFGLGSVAAEMSQTVVGMYNQVSDLSGVGQCWGDKAFIVGNGEGPSNRSNAFTVDWDGNIEASGGMRARGTINAEEVCCYNLEVECNMEIGGTINGLTLDKVEGGTASTLGTPLANITVSEVNYAKRCGVAMVRIVLKTTVARSGTWNAFTLASGWRPVIMSGGEVWANSGALTVNIAATGNVQINGTLAANAQLIILATFLVA